MQQEYKLYKMDTKTKCINIIINFFVILIVLIAMNVIFGYQTPGFALAIGVSVGVGLVLFPKIYVYPDRVYFRQGFKKNTLHYNEGTFQLVEKKGFAAFVVALKFKKVLGIIYIPNNNPKLKVPFGWMLKTEEVQEMFDYIQNQKKIRQHQ